MTKPKKHMPKHYTKTDCSFINTHCLDYYKITMKRAATVATTNSKKRQMRSASRRMEEEAACQKDEARRMANGRKRAHQLSATPLLQALPGVFKSGFLYKHDILRAAEASTEWDEIWKEVEDELHEDCQVEVQVDLDREEWPAWAKARGLDEVIPSQAFARKVFDTVIDLKAAAKKTVGQQEKNSRRVAKMGKDLHGLLLRVWGPTKRNSGGIAVRLVRRIDKENSWILNYIDNFLIRLDPNLRLWTGIRTWHVYDQEPLWDWEWKPGHFENDSDASDED
jgi:hypothetical protein